MENRMYRQAKTLFVVSALTLGLSQAYAATTDTDFIVTTPNPNAYAVFTGNSSYTREENGVIVTVTEPEPALLLQNSEEGRSSRVTHIANGSTYDSFPLNQDSDNQAIVSAFGMTATTTDDTNLLFHEARYHSNQHEIHTTDINGIRSSAVQDANGITYTRTDINLPQDNADRTIEDAGYYRSGFFVGEVSTDGETLYAPELNADNANIEGDLHAENVLADIVSADTVLSDVVSSKIAVTELSLSDSVMTNEVYTDSVTANSAAIGNVNADNVVTTNVVADKVFANDASLADVKAVRVSLSADATKNDEAVRLGQLTTVIDAKIQAAQLPSNQTVTNLQNNVNTLGTTVLALGNSVEQLDAKLDRSVRNLEKEHNVAMAKQAALNGLFQPYSVGKANVTAALGGYGSDTAVAVGAGYRLNEHLAGKAGVAFASGNKKTAYNVAVNYEF